METDFPVGPGNGVRSVAVRWGSLFSDVSLPEGRERDVVGAADDDAGVFGGGVEVIGDGFVDEGHATFVVV